MLKIQIEHSSHELDHISVQSLEEKVKTLIIRDLYRLNWKIKAHSNSIEILPPDHYDREVIVRSMAFKRTEIIQKNSVWINKHLKLARESLAHGADVLKSRIQPQIEVCKTQKQHDIFRIFRYYWSSPYSDYVGRRIKILVRDASIKGNPVIGIAALGSPIIHVPERDNWVGWDTKTRTKNLIYAMDAYVVGALPPYNHLLGGKLMSYILTSDEIRDIYNAKYSEVKTIIENRVCNQLACIFTTSLYGRSSQYNRIKYKDKLLYIPIGETKGYGTLHLTDETFNAMQEYLISKGVYVTNKFGDGPCWRMRVIRAVGELLDIDSDFLLRHSFKRKIYAIPLASNMLEFLQGADTTLKNYKIPFKQVVKHWKQRWLMMRLRNPDVIREVQNFRPSMFKI